MLRALIIEDHRPDNQRIAEMLEKIGFHTTSAYSGSTAISIIRESLRSNNPFHLILTDGQVPPGPTGAEIIAHLQGHERYRGTPIIASSAEPSMWDDLRNIENIHTQEKKLDTTAGRMSWNLHQARKKVQEILPTLPSP